MEDGNIFAITVFDEDGRRLLAEGGATAAPRRRWSGCGRGRA
jgi:hypothetical protein